MPQWTDLKAIVVDATGPELTADERDLFASEKPAGFILFKRNCISRNQVRELVASVREVVGHPDLPILIDQEGGVVSRLHAPEWREYPSAKVFGELVKFSTPVGAEAAHINSTLMALDMAEIGITVNCAPVVDVPSADCHEFLSGTRTYSDDPLIVGAMGEAVCRGLLDGGVTPVIKHIPGHGRAKVDSHLSLPVVDTSHAELSVTDFSPFKYLARSDLKHALWAMSAHVMYTDLDRDNAATLSKKIVDTIIRGEIGFEGVLLADDVTMEALSGTLKSRIEQTMAVGMDLTMICSNPFAARVEALSYTPKLNAQSAARIAAAEAARKSFVKQGNDNKPQLEARLASLMEKKKAV